MNRYRLFIANYLPRTENHPTRVKIWDARFSDCVIIPFKNRVDSDAQEFLESKGIKLCGDGEMDTKDFFVTEDFDTRIK